MHRISNSKMTQLSYWTPSRSTKYLINRVKNIIEKWGRIDVGGNVNKSLSLAVTNIEAQLMKLSSLIDSVNDDDEIDKDEEFIKFDFSEKLTKKTVQKSGAKTNQKELWKAGTGYGYQGTSSWDPEEYIKLQKEKDKSISTVITKIVEYLQNTDNKSNDFFQMCEVVSQSLLPSYIKNQFKNSTLLEMQNREALFKLYVSLIEALTSEKSIYLFDIKYDGESIHDVLKKLSKMLTSALKLDKNNEFMQITNNLLEVLVFPTFDEYKKEQEKESKNSTPHLALNTSVISTVTKKSNRELYPSVMKKYAFDYSHILLTNYRDVYCKMFQKEGGASWTQCQKRLSVEVPSFAQDNHLPIDYDASIFLRVDEDNPMIMRALITGPPGTPYDSGCLIFDIYVKSEFPKSPPEVWFMNHGGNRFNPNLYADGKVCLSILGTWSAGSQSEKWNEKTSSLLQILISIQSQILVDEPYFNEPGHERSIGTANGKSYSESYNANIRLYVLKSAMRDLLVNPSLYPQFETVITNHFKLKKEYITALCDKWENAAPDSLKPQYQKIIKEIKDKLSQL
jgi:ubiquitin-protein ligase